MYSSYNPINLMLYLKKVQKRSLGKIWKVKEHFVAPSKSYIRIFFWGNRIGIRVF